jgi:DNA mismatch repair protein MutS
MFDQYRRIKQEHKGTVLFFRLGDFYEMFADDAVEVSNLLNLTLTNRNGLPMCGIPYHAARTYIARLLRLGKKVAICEQISEPGHGLIQRKVVEVVTPGTTVDEDFLDKGSANYLSCLSTQDSLISFAYIDLSAGDFFATSFPDKDAVPRLREELERLQIKEIIVQESLLDSPAIASALAERGGLVINKWGDWLFDRERSLKRLKKQFGSALKGFGLDETKAEVIAAGALLDYLDETSGSLIPHIKTMQLYRDFEYVSIDESSQRNLELIRNLQDGEVRFSLLEVLDETRTAMGRRLLKHRILYPLRNEAHIEARLNMLEAIYRDQALSEQLRELRVKTPDLERLRSRLAMDKAHGKDMLSIRNALAQWEVIESLSRTFVFESHAAASLDTKGFTRLVELHKLLSQGLYDDPSIILTEGNLIKSGYSPELDKLHRLRDSGHQMLEAYLEEERVATGIANLKIRFNRLIGYFFEVTNAQLPKVPRHFIKRQGTVGSGRYSSERLVALESDINSAAGRIIDLEKQLFIELREEAKTALTELEAAGKRIAELDTAQSLARAATMRLWSRPVLHNNASLDLIEARHPVVEAHLSSGEFIPNDIHLDNDGVSFALITGPNMAGKSTYLRQAALIVIMAQMGSFVPAKEARVGLVDRIYCRVGASDNLARGESTFLVEMNETAYILHTATEKSLVIMDEVGRGTGTNDGLSIAWAVSEELLDSIRCRTLFATHYHELSALSNPRLANRSMEVVDDDGELVFLRKLKEGAAAESYGLHAARLAGLPERVLKRAGEIMEHLQDSGRSLSAGGAAAGIPPHQAPARAEQGVMPNGVNQLINELTALNLDNLSPRDALNQLYAWRSLLQSKPRPHKKPVDKGPSLF